MLIRPYSLRSGGRQGLGIWEEEKYRKLQGTYPVISLSFANIKEDTYEGVRRRIYQILADLYEDYSFYQKKGI